MKSNLFRCRCNPRRWRKLRAKHDEDTLAIAAMIQDMEAVARNGKGAEPRRLARVWLDACTPEERAVAKELAM